MQSFSIRDLREKTGELSRTAEQGELSLVTRPWASLIHQRAF